MVDPFACRHCGVSQREHGGIWAPSGTWMPRPVGWHNWTEPTWEQRCTPIIANVIEQRKAQTNRQLMRALHVPYVWDVTAALDKWLKNDQKETRNA